MVHLIFCLRRKPPLSRQEFQRYWREVHAPLVARHARILGIERYVQAHTIDPAGTRSISEARGTPDPYDGVAEIWLRLEELGKSPKAAEAGRELIEDERRFIDLANSPIFLAEDHVIVGS